MNILIACEESQAVTIEMRKLGHNAFSCDIIDCSGGHPEWHIKQDVIPLLNGHCKFTTCDGTVHTISGKWDMIIAHPPCTYLTVTGNRWYNVERYGEKALIRRKYRTKAVEFFMRFTRACCDKIAIENPIGCMSTIYQKPDQIIHPYYFGDPERKATCLWLKNLPLLQPTCVVEPDVYYYTAKNGRIKSDSRWRSQCKREDRAKHRAKTFSGIAKAMAEQWAGNIFETKGENK